MTCLILSKIQLHLGGLAGAIAIGEGTCAPGTAASGLLVAVQRCAEPVPAACQPSPLIPELALPSDTTATCFCMYPCWCNADDKLFTRACSV